MENTGKSLGARIQAYRKETGQTQAQFAESAKISDRGLQEIERGKIKDPGIETLAKIAKHLGVSLDELYTGETQSTISEGKADLLISLYSIAPTLNEDELRSLIDQARAFTEVKVAASKRPATNS